MSKTILVIDDELGYRTLIKSDLTRLKYKILAAASGPEALEILKDKPVDLVISDMKMSPMDGLDTVVAIRKERPRIPIVLMTGYALEERVQKAMSHKVNVCLRKPFGLEEMRDVVHALVGSGSK